jgi:hypothetical protein
MGGLKMQERSANKEYRKDFYIDCLLKYFKESHSSKDAVTQYNLLEKYKQDLLKESYVFLRSQFLRKAEDQLWWEYLNNCVSPPI